MRLPRGKQGSNGVEMSSGAHLVLVLLFTVYLVTSTEESTVPRMCVKRRENES